MDNYEAMKLLQRTAKQERQVAEELMRINDALVAENARLRAALEKVAGCWSPRPTMDGKDYGHFNPSTMIRLRPEIFAALSPAEKGEA